ncbi:t-SNARE [Jimgerdemannia flammicorona]|uniref:t-SNARE n=1 Tax=Jimgerdemannia flammicorona TaxID=994334 RepID=A0A433D7T4_9FUNG|nr:t-SNARE [Jimgerdemannia flammicorona]
MYLGSVTTIYSDDDYPPPPPVPSSYRNNHDSYQDGNRRYQDSRYESTYSSYDYEPPSLPQPAATRQHQRQSPQQHGDYQNEDDEYEMRRAAQYPAAPGPTDPNSMQGFFDEVESIKDAIREINDIITEIEDLHSASLANTNEEQTAKNSKQLDKLIAQTNKMNNGVKNRIKAMELNNARMPSNSGDLQMRQTQHSALKKRFLETITHFQDVERTFQQKYRQRVERQIKIVKPDATPEEIEDVLDSDEPPQIFAQSLMQANRSGQARAVLSEVQARHDDIKKIEKTILELHQLFMDMNTLVEQQGEVMKNIETVTEATVIQMEEGKKEVEKAVVSARATRSKKWCCFVIFIIVTIVAAILVWWFVLKHPGVNISNSVLTPVINASTPSQGTAPIATSRAKSHP